jgi:hypothetical protein
MDKIKTKFCQRYLNNDNLALKFAKLKITGQLILSGMKAKHWQLKKKNKKKQAVAFTCEHSDGNSIEPRFLL